MTAELDRWLPPRGPCGICGGPDARHRVIDTIVDQVAAGEDVAGVAAELELPVEAVYAALAYGREGKA